MQNTGRADAVRAGVLALVDFIVLRPIFNAAASVGRLWQECREEVAAEREALYQGQMPALMGARGGESGSGRMGESEAMPAPKRAVRGSGAASGARKKPGRPRKAKATPEGE